MSSRHTKPSGFRRSSTFNSLPAQGGDQMDDLKVSGLKAASRQSKQQNIQSARRPAGRSSKASSLLVAGNGGAGGQRRSPRQRVSPRVGMRSKPSTLQSGTSRTPRRSPRSAGLQSPMAGLPSTSEFSRKAAKMTRDQLISYAAELLEVARSHQTQPQAAAKSVHPSTLLEISELLNSDMDLVKVMNKVVSALNELVPAEQINLWFVSGKQVMCDASTSASVLGTKCPLTGILGYVVKTGRTVNMNKPQNDWKFDRMSDQRAGVELNNLLSVAVRATDGHTVAVLEAVNARGGRRKGRQFTQADELLLLSMSSLLSLLLGKAYVDLQAELQTTEQQALHLMASYTNNDFSLYDVSRKITRAVHMVIPAQLVLVYVIVPRGHQHSLIVFESSRPGTALGREDSTEFSIDNEELGQGDPNNNSGSNNVNNAPKILLELPLTDDTIAGHVAVTGRATNVPDVSKDYRANNGLDDQLGIATQSVIAVPVTDYLGKTVAVIEARNRLFVPNSLSRDHDDAKRAAAAAASNDLPPLLSSSSSQNLSLSRRSSSILRGDSQPSQRMAFAKDDLDRLQNMATLSASMIRQVQLYQTAVEARQRTQTLLQITELMSAESGTETLFKRIIDASYQLVQAERISFFVVEDIPVTADEPDNPNDPLDDAPNNSDIPHSESSVSLSHGPLLRRASTTFGFFDTQRASGGIRKEIICRISKDRSFIGRRVAWGSGLVGHVALTGKTLNIANAYQDPRFDPSSDKATGFRTHSILTVPVTDWDGSVLGVLQAVNKCPPPHFDESVFAHDWAFGPEDREALQSLASSTGVILRKALAFETAIRAERKSRSLVNLMRISAKSGPLPEIMKAIVDVAYDILQAERVTIFFVNKNKREIFTVVSKDAAGLVVPMGRGIAGHVAETGHVLNIPDAYQCKYFSRDMDVKSGFRTQSVLCMPVRDHDGSIVAVVQALNKKLLIEPEVYGGQGTTEVISFNKEDVLMLEAFCYQMRSTIRKHATDAMLNRLNVDDVDSRIRSLIDLYSEKGALRRASVFDFENVAAPESWVFPSIDKSNISELDDTNFNVFQHSDDELLALCISMFQATGMTDQHNLDSEALQSFLLAVRAHYRTNPFHNFKHAFSVMHFAFLSLKHDEVSQHLTPTDVLCLLVASLCHDIDHPGNTNTFEINTSSELAIIHNDQAVLENHHAVTTFKILRNNKCNIFRHMGRQQYQTVRSGIIGSILATDMAKHFTFCKTLEDLGDPPFNREDPASRQMLCNMLIHASDLSGQVFPIPIAKIWEDRISTEFARQADEERKLGLAVAPFMQSLNDPVQRAKLQVNFIDFVLTPWWDKVVRLVPSLQYCALQLQANRAYFVSLTTKGHRGNTAADEKNND